MNNLTLGSLFDGSGGFPLGGLLSGITPLWASEIEPFPIMVTSKRLPQMKHLGDISTVNGADIEPVDIITFGSPCTDMSVAGKRAGLEGQQSVLFYEAIRIVKEMRCKTNGKYPRFVVWENVPGAFSSNKGEDFRAVLEEICKVKDSDISVTEPPKEKWSNAGNIMADEFSLAWRVFDAQFWGVPQRRRRIYLVADFADECAAKILFESEGVSGYPPQGFCPWKESATDVTEGTGETGTVCLNDQGGNRMDVTEDMTCTLRAKSNHPPLVFENHSQDSRYVGPLDKSQTVLATFGTGGNNQPFVMEVPKTLKIRSGCEGGGKGPLIQENKSATLSCHNDQTLFVPKAYGICSKDSNSMKSGNPNSGFYSADTSRTLDKNGGNPACNQGGIAVVALQGSMIGRKDENGPQGNGINEDVSFTLNTVDHHVVAYSARTASGKEVFGTLEASMGAKQWLGNQEAFSGDYHIIEPEYVVRRLTPTECARLQGFPDWWCDELNIENPTEEEIKWWGEVFETYCHIIGTATKPKSEKQIVKWLKHPYSDSAEYKMWGNGVALPCVCFVLAGIVYYTQNNSL